MGLTWNAVGWWAGRVGGEIGFVGRERELSGLRAALGGDARLLLVVGDAGVGKTRFAGEGVRLASADGMVSLWGACLPLAEKVPLLPVAEALGELGRLDGGSWLDGALEVAPPYVRGEVARLLPQVGEARANADSGEDLRDRLFTAVAELLRAVARTYPVCLAIEDVHWADSATLDFLTFLARSGHGVPVTAVVTCRGDEPLDPQVVDWLAYVRGSAWMQEIRLGPLSRDEVAEHAGALMGGRPAARFADELYARAEGNPFFTEQLVAAVVSDRAGGSGGVPPKLPARLAELLVVRVSRCGAAARAVLDGLSVAGRPLTESLLCEVTGLGADTVRSALRELAAARLLADSTAGGTQQPRHALLSEAVAGSLLPGERAALHERTALVFEGTGDSTLAAETAGHWAAAGRADKELPARLAAAAVAERVYGYAEAAAHRQRAIELYPDVPEAGQAGIDLPRLYLRAIRALENSGDSEKAGKLAEEAYCRFASHPDPATAAVVHQWAGFFRGTRTPAAGLPLIKEALRLFEQAPPSADQSEAWLIYGNVFLLHAQGRQEAGLAALNRALEIAEAVGATAIASQILSVLAFHTLLCGQVEEGFALLHRGRALAEASGDSETALWQTCHEVSSLNLMAEFEKANEAALAGLQAARNTGRQTSNDAAVLASSACDALLARGHTADAAALIDPLITGPPDLDNWPMHLSRAEIDLLRGDIAAAGERQRQITALIRHISSIIIACETAQRTAELALWASRPGDALAQVQRVLALFTAPYLTIFCGRLLAAGMAACADLDEQARARRDGHWTSVAVDAASELASWVDRMAGTPFTDHPFVAAIPAERATWNAERTRLGGASDPAAWRAAAKTWQDLGCPHRAAYAWWRHAEAQLNAGQPSAAAAEPLLAAATAAEGHVPLLAEIRKLAERARIPLQTPPGTSPVPDLAETPAPYGLTGRERAVLRLLAAGRTNAQIGAELYISPKTAGVHVSNILRKLGVTNRVQAAALAERAGLLHKQQP